MVALEEADRSRNHMAKKKAQTYHSYVIVTPSNYNIIKS
jgi:hypothetical protein